MKSFFDIRGHMRCIDDALIDIEAELDVRAECIVELERRLAQKRDDVIIDVRNTFESDAIEAWKEHCAELERQLAKAMRIIFPCTHCGGIGKLDDAGPGDISFNTWECPYCQNFNVEREKKKLLPPPDALLGP